MIRYHPRKKAWAEGEIPLGALACNMRKGLALPPPNATFAYTGIEIELENVRDWDASDIRPWSIVPDGSLRNSGMELLSAPIKSPGTLANYINVYSRLRGENSWQDSIRTSTHVHMDVRNRSLPELAKLVAAYCIVEPFLYKFCGAYREENIYCIPFYRADNFTEDFVAAITGNMELDMFFSSVPCKYSGLFVGPVATYGTIEFRMAPSWPRGERVLEWVNLLQGFYFAALNMSPLHAAMLIDQGAYEELLRSLLPQQYWEQHDVTGLIEDNLCDRRALAIYELFMPTKESKWVCPQMPVVKNVTSDSLDIPLSALERYRSNLLRRRPTTEDIERLRAQIDMEEGPDSDEDEDYNEPSYDLGA
jgi:hypothetical protein